MKITHLNKNSYVDLSSLKEGDTFIGLDNGTYGIVLKNGISDEWLIVCYNFSRNMVQKYPRNCQVAKVEVELVVS